MTTPYIAEHPPVLTDLEALRILRDSALCASMELRERIENNDPAASPDYLDLLGRALDRCNTMIARLNCSGGV
jgi:hypothetical protein